MLFSKEQDRQKALLLCFIYYVVPGFVVSFLLIIMMIILHVLYNRNYKKIPATVRIVSVEKTQIPSLLKNKSHKDLFSALTITPAPTFKQNVYVVSYEFNGIQYEKEISSYSPDTLLITGKRKYEDNQEIHIYVKNKQPTNILIDSPLPFFYFLWGMIIIIVLFSILVYVLYKFQPEWFCVVTFVRSLKR